MNSLLRYLLIFLTASVYGAPFYRVEDHQFNAHVSHLAYVSGGKLCLRDIATLTEHVIADPADLLQGDEELSEAELARCERKRVNPRSISEFTWSGDGERLCFALAGRIYIYDVERQELERPDEFPGDCHDVRFSPRGNYISFVHDNNLYVHDGLTFDAVWYTDDGNDTLSYGEAEFVAQEELHRFTGYVWSPDDAHLAFTSVDSSAIPVSVRVEVHEDGAKILKDRYPFAGGPNVTWAIHLLDLDELRVRRVTGDATTGYLARMDWDPTSVYFYFQYLNRAQSELTLYRCNIEEEKLSPLLTNSNDAWVNVHNDLCFTENGTRLLWTNEHSGFRHIYLVDPQTGSQKALTSGEWPVERIVGVSAKEVFFEARLDPREKHLYAVPLAGGEPRALTSAEGVHTVSMAPDASCFVDSYSTLEFAQREVFCSADGSLEQEFCLKGARDSSDRVRFGIIAAPEGHDLYYRVYLPADFNPEQRYPAAIGVYGGPGVQRVQKVWSGGTAHYCRMLADAGYVVFTLDNRGTPGRGVEFERAIHLRLGDPEVDDQITGLNFLQELDYVDPDRIGVVGWSYGGYMALLLALKAELPAVSINPVTDWRSYDTAYTERYLSTPQDNEAGYTYGCVMTWADQLHTPLCLIAGQADDNVFYFQNTMRLLAEFARLDKLVEERHYPGQRHGISDYYENVVTTLLSFFDRHVAGREF